MSRKLKLIKASNEIPNCVWRDIGSGIGQTGKQVIIYTILHVQ